MHLQPHSRSDDGPHVPVRQDATVYRLGAGALCIGGAVKGRATL